MSDHKYHPALTFLQSMPRSAIIDWMTHSEIGRTALQALERKLTTQREPHAPDASAKRY
jgi:hypothetical protein